ncbi:MAG: extracellular solute-binding protein [Eubacteriales bacterium]|nr:extracellular solute-binding protein [Eubacteriales bacterium]
MTKRQGKDRQRRERTEQTGISKSGVFREKKDVFSAVFAAGGTFAALVLLALTAFCGSATALAAGEEPVHIVMTYQTYEGSRLQDLQEVEEAVNAITVPELGVEVEFLVVGAQDAYTEYSLWISNRKQVDLMMLNYQDITAYISRDMLLPLDELLEEEAPDIAAVLKERDLTEGAVIEEQVYGVTPVTDAFGSGGGLWVPYSLVQESGIAYEETRVYTLEELSGFFALWKECYPDAYPLGQITSGATYSTMSYYGMMTDGLGGDVSTGVLDRKNGSKIVNFFAGEEYREFLEYLRQWYLDGYIYPDAAFTDTPKSELFAEGILLSNPLSSQPGFGGSAQFGEDAVCLRTSAVTAGHQYARSGFWVIPSSARHPEAAMRFLNAMYGDVRIANLIQYGIEGKHYVVLEEESRRIGFPEGVNAQNTGYYNVLGLYGDRRKMYTFDSEELIEQKRRYSEEALQNQEPARDFVYSTQNVEKEIAAVQKIVEYYVPVLESGSVDLDRYYPEFLEELEKAGISEIIADKQAQYDAWLTVRK